MATKKPVSTDVVSSGTPQAVAVPRGTQIAETTPSDLLRMAVAQNADLDKLERLYDLQQRWEADAARRAYVVAMTEFKKNPPEILKDKTVKIKHKTGDGVTQYNHATLANVTSSIIAGLAAVDISHSWNVEQLDGGMVVVTCKLTHARGHSETVTMRAGRDESGSKNNIQAVASTVSYLQRYTLLSATGLATKDMDDDGGSSEIEYVSQEQEATLRALAEDVGADLPKFLRYMAKLCKVEIDGIGRIPANAYADAVSALNAKRTQAPA